MKEFQLTDRVVVEVLDTQPRGKSSPVFIAEQLRKIAEKIEYECIKGDSETYQSIPENEIEIKWEYECGAYGGFRMGNRSLISDAYYGTKEFFEVCSLSKEDIEQQGFDASKLDADDMQRIASKQGDLINDCCDYWTALTAACEYWEVPRKED